MDEREYTLNFLKRLTGGDNEPVFSRKEKSAMCTVSEMTQDIFNGCLDACASAGNFPEFLEMFERFPEYGRSWCAKLAEQTACFGEEGGSELSEADVRERWNAFVNRVRIDIGPETAEKLTDDIFLL